MSASDVEIARRGFEAFNRGEIEASLADFAEDAEWHPYLGSLEGRVFRGRAQIGAMLRGFGQEMERFRVEVREVIDPARGGW